MAITAAFNLKIKQYNTVNVFANTPLLKPLYCVYPEGYKKAGKALIAIRALYGLRVSPLL
jgi:hypothetical protein